VDILISDDLIARLNTKDEYILTEIGECELRGRDEKVILKSVEVKV
jgi:hypothetical protein